MGTAEVTDDIAKYESSKQFIKNLYDRNKDREDIKTMISLYACASHVPCIAVAYWIGEFSNWHPDVISNIKTLIESYGYEEILNKPKGSPI